MKLSIQNGGLIDNLSCEETYALIAEAGFEAIDWNIDIACKGENITKLSFPGISIFEKSLEDVTVRAARNSAIML